MPKLWVILLPCALLACSLIGQPDAEVGGSSASTAGGASPPAMTAPAPYYGPASIEELVSSSDAVVRARLLDSATEVVTSTVEGWNEGYYVAIKFRFSVSEYIYGSGANTITAYWVSSGQFETAQDAEALAPTYTSRRNTQWDSREAILFLGGGEDAENPFSVLAQPQDVYVLRVGASVREDSSYVLADRHYRPWLPAVSGATPSNQEYILEDLVEGPMTSSITLRDLKARVGVVADEINEGSGSVAYKKCLRHKYGLVRHEEWRQRENPQYTNYDPPAWDGVFESGQAAGTELYRYEDEGVSQVVGGVEEKTRLRLDGDDVALFSVREVNQRPFIRGGTQFDFAVVAERPIPRGAYEFGQSLGTLVDCGDIASFVIAVNVSAPVGTLHELFFDPVEYGLIVNGPVFANPDGDGVLAPNTFTTATGQNVTISLVSYELQSRVRIVVEPLSALADHLIDIIELDGTVSLSLDVEDAAVDSANDTLSWSVSSQPWEDGDKLMVRIRDARQCSRGAVTNPNANPGLMADCETLLTAKDALRGSASLNWGAETAIIDWTGIKVTGTPSRVTSLDLSMRGLDGSIPSGLGSLTDLDILSLDNNRLTGSIPSELGSLTNLRFLYLYKNRLTGAIPPELGSLASLNTMWLFNNQLTGSIPAELEDLSNLERLGLDNNELTGCIPPELRDVPENDLGRLGLSDCVVPGPVSIPTVGAGDESLDVSWTASSEDGGSPVTRYKVRYKRSADTSWTDGGTVTATDTTISGLVNGTPYEVQVRACSVGGCGSWSASGTGTPQAPL